MARQRTRERSHRREDYDERHQQALAATPDVSRRRRSGVRLHPATPHANPPATIANGKPIGRGQLLVVQEDASGRIVALDSSSYLGPHKTLPTDVIVVGSYCGTRILAPMFTRGVKAVIATDAGIGKDNAGISGLLHGETIGVPVATIAAKSAETSNGRATLLLARSAAPTRRRGRSASTPGMIAYEAAARLAKAPPGKSIPTPLGEEEAAVVVEETPQRPHLGDARHHRDQGEDPERRDLQRRQFQPGFVRWRAAHGRQGLDRQRRRRRPQQHRDRGARRARAKRACRAPRSGPCRRGSAKA